MQRDCDVRPQAFELPFRYTPNRKQILDPPKLSAFVPKIYDSLRRDGTDPGQFFELPFRGAIQIDWQADALPR